MAPYGFSEGLVHRFLETLGVQCFLGPTQQCVVNLQSGASRHVVSIYKEV